jgi:hypothetical protein
MCTFLAEQLASHPILINNKLQRQMETHYTHLSKTLDHYKPNNENRLELHTATRNSNNSTQE